jgi:hypothetical protein
MTTKNNKAATEKTSAAGLSQEQPTIRADGTTSKTASDVAGTEAPTTTSHSITVTKKSSAPAAPVVNGTNVPSITVPDLTTLPPDDLMTASENVWKLGRSAHEAVVACFKEIMYRYDGRKSNCPTYANVEEAFASIGVNYEAARKLVYRDIRKRDLEAIAASLHLPPATTSKSTPTSIFNIGDGVTVSEGDGVIEHVHQTTGKLDVVLHETEETVENVSPQDVTKLNGVVVIDGKVVKQKEHFLVAGELLIDAATGKKWTFADGVFSVSKMPTRNENKQDAVAKLKAKREATRLRTEKKKKERKAKATRKDLAKIEAAKAEREAARLRKEEKKKRKTEAARKELAKIEAAKAGREAKLSAKSGHKKTNGTNVPRTFQWNLIQGSEDPQPYAVSNNKGEILSYFATEPEAAAEVERLTTKYKALAIDVATGGHLADAHRAEEAISVNAPAAPMQPGPSVATA